MLCLAYMIKQSGGLPSPSPTCAEVTPAPTHLKRPLLQWRIRRTDHPKRRVESNAPAAFLFFSRFGICFTILQSFVMVWCFCNYQVMPTRPVSKKKMSFVQAGYLNGKKSPHEWSCRGKCAMGQKKAWPNPSTVPHFINPKCGFAYCRSCGNDSIKFPAEEKTFVVFVNKYCKPTLSVNTDEKAKIKAHEFLHDHKLYENGKN